MLNCTPLPSGLVVYDIWEVSNDVRSAVKVLFKFTVQLKIIIFQKQEKRFVRYTYSIRCLNSDLLRRYQYCELTDIFVISEENCCEV